jgi:hypothetical protein
MSGRSHDEETAAAQHVLAVVGGDFQIHDTGSEPGQYDVDITTRDGVSVALEVTSFGGEHWRRTAARVAAARKNGSFVGDGLRWEWWVIFPSGADLRAMEAPLTELLHRLEREGKADGVNRRYDGPDANLREAAARLAEIGVSTVTVWEVEPDEDAPRILLSQSDTWVGGAGDLVAALTALFEKRDNQEKLARAEVDERHLYVFMEDGGASSVLEGAWPNLPTSPGDPHAVVDTLWIYSPSASSSLLFRNRPGTNEWERFNTATGEPA